YFFQSLLPGMLLRRALVGRERTRSKGASDRRAAQHRALDAPGQIVNALFAAACAIERGARRLVPLRGLPGASIWFSLRITDPNPSGAGRRSTARTGDAR